MKIATLAKLSMVIAGILILAMLYVVAHTASHTQQINEELQTLGEIDRKAAELGIAKDHLLLGEPNPAIVRGIHDHLESLDRALAEVAHPVARPARQHVAELGYIVSAIGNENSSNTITEPPRPERAAIIGGQMRLHLSGLTSAVQDITAERQASLTTARETAIRNMLILIAALALGAFTLIVLIHRRVSHRARTLQQALRNFQGDPPQGGIPDLGGDELGQLASAFREMIATRLRHEREIENYQAELEDSIARLKETAYWDPLTGLRNRDGFLERLGQQAPPQGSLIALNLTGMRDINETHGYRQGDRLLIELGQRLQEWTGETGLVGRLGGDEFVVYLPEERSPSRGEDIGQELSRVLTKPFAFTGAQIEIDPCFGIAALDDDPIDSLRCAETALFHARAETGTHWQTYSEEMATANRERLQITAELSQAILDQQFELYYQPQVRLADGALCFAESLIRWHHPDQGIVLPGRFMPVAERSQLIVPIGEWILDEACRQIREWQDEGLCPVQITVNVSLAQILASNFVRTVRSALERYEVPARLLSLEITESLFDDRHASVLEQVRSLRAMGVQISVDDFGTGYSSLRYLNQYPIDVIKLDRSFVSDAPNNVYSRAICEMVLRIGRELGTMVIAEGIETEEERRAMQDLDCLYAQGFYFSYPLPARDFTELLRNRKRLPLTRA